MLRRIARSLIYYTVLVVAGWAAIWVLCGGIDGVDRMPAFSTSMLLLAALLGVCYLLDKRRIELPESK